MKAFVAAILMALSPMVSDAGLLYNYSQLALKDLDQMSTLIQNKIKESRKSGGEKDVPLKECLQAVYSRPNEDFLIEKIISPLRNELEEHDAWEKTVKSLVKESTGALKNSKAFTPVVQVTYLVFLENLLSEMKPKSQEAFENKIIGEIRDANIKISKEAEKERKMRMMKASISPSEIAATILTEKPAPAVVSAPVSEEPVPTATPAPKTDN